MGVGQYRPDDRRRRCLQAILLGGFLFILIRLFHVQILVQDFYTEDVAARITSSATPLSPQPGAILARDRQPLAKSLLMYRLSAAPRTMLKHGEALQGVARQLGEVLDRPSDELYRELSEHPNSLDVTLQRFISAENAEQIRDLKIDGLSMPPAWKRHYPQGSLACHILGGRDHRNTPLEGFEYFYRAILDPQPGADDNSRSGGSRNSMGAPPRPGKDLQLTIDLALQQQVESELQQVWERERPKWACAVVMDPRTGEVLALGTRPGFDPNLFVEQPAGVKGWSGIPRSATQNIPISAAIEQGSTFKVLLAAAALDAGVVTPQTTMRCGGSINIGGRPIGCWGRYGASGHGTLDMAGMIAHSCNIVAAQVALRLGPEKYCAFLKKCGIGQDPEAGFPGEAFGLLAPATRLRPRDIATMGFGQNVSCSALQLATAVSGVVNDGLMPHPHIVKAVLNPDGSVFRQSDGRSEQLCSPATSASVRSMLQYTVDAGTGRAVQMPDFKVGGKTGTAQQWDKVNKRHYTDRYMVSFIEVAPIDDPRYVIYFGCNEPKVGQHGSDVAAPSCKRIAEYALRRLDHAAAPASSPASVPTTSQH